MALIHGGQLEQIAKQYKIPPTDWLDLSTGIAPTSYPIPHIPLSAWQNLPQENAGLFNSAKQYYQCSELVITNGSQAIIKSLPELYRQKNPNGQDVYLPERGYKEHAHAWKIAGYHLHFYQELLPEISELKPNSVLVIINPNNPTGKFFDRNVISKYHATLKQLNGLLVIDEAFMDVMPNEQSYCSQVNDSHSLVLRSFGKFFGLAGIRIGFLVADNAWCQTFKALLGPWQVNGPAQIIAQHALSNKLWKEKQKDTLHLLRKVQEKLFLQVLPNDLLVDIKGCDLFIALHFNHPDIAKNLYHLLCKQGVYCRLADEQDTLRFGITTEETLGRLEISLRNACRHLKLDIIKANNTY